MENNPRSDDSLSTIQEARAALADRYVTPIWYHPILGLVVFGLALGLGLDFDHKTIAFVALALTALALVLTYMRLTGIVVTGAEPAARARRPRVLMVALVVPVGVLLASSYLLGGEGVEWAPWACGAVAFVLTVVLGRVYDNAVRAELRRD